MAANTSPIFSLTANVGIINGVATANTSKDLTSGTIYLVAIADSTNGSYIDKLIVQPDGTNVATALRVWLNNGGVTGTAANNSMIKDVTMAATTNSEVAAIGNTEIVLGFAIPASWRIYVTIGTTVSAGFHVTAVGGNY